MTCALGWPAWENGGIVATCATVAGAIKTAEAVVGWSPGAVSARAARVARVVLDTGGGRAELGAMRLDQSLFLQMLMLCECR